MIPSQSLRRSRGERRGAAGSTNATAAWWAGAAVEQGATARLHPEPGGSICIGCTSATSASASSGCWAAVGVENGRTVWGSFESAGPDAPSVWSGWFLTPGGKETPSVNPSCGRWLALARCHRGGSPRTFQRAASSPRGAQATPHPGKRNDRAPPPPASPRRAAPRLASPRLAAAHAHTHPRARARSARAKQPSTRVSSREPKGPDSNREPARPPQWRFCKGTQGQCLI